MSTDKKPFNLEAALTGAKVVTRDGREVTQLVKFETTEGQPLRGVVNGLVTGWCATGEYFKGDQDQLDLFMAPQKKKLWVWIEPVSSFGIHRVIGAREDSEKPTFIPDSWQQLEVEIDV